MKKVTSAALLAIQLSWKVVLLHFAVTLGVQVFFVWRELMPGGVPLQVTFGFENLLRSAVQGAGRYWMALLVAFLAATAWDKKNKTVYTMNRLGLSELTVTMIFGLVFSGYFLLYWAFQLGVAYGFFVWYSRFALVSSNTFMLACWRSEWLHTLLPLGEWWGYLRNLVICLSFGFSAAFTAHRGRRGKVSLIWVIPPALCIFLLSGQIATVGQDIVLMVLLVLFTLWYFFTLKGGREDEDL